MPPSVLRKLREALARPLERSPSAERLAAQGELVRQVRAEVASERRPSSAAWPAPSPDRSSHPRTHGSQHDAVASSGPAGLRNLRTT